LIPDLRMEQQAEGATVEASAPGENGNGTSSKLGSGKKFVKVRDALYLECWQPWKTVDFFFVRNKNACCMINLQLLVMIPVGIFLSNNIFYISKTSERVKSSFEDLDAVRFRPFSSDSDVWNQIQIRIQIPAIINYIFDILVGVCKSHKYLNHYCLAFWLINTVYFLEHIPAKLISRRNLAENLFRTGSGSVTLV
jgi:hypothetical protein